MRISDWSSDVCSSDLVVEAHQLAEVGLHVLRGIELLPLARRDPQLAVAAEQQAVAVVAAAADLGHLAPDHLQAFRSEERRVGKEGVRTCRSRWSPYH